MFRKTKVDDLVITKQPLTQQAAVSTSKSIFDWVYVTQHSARRVGVRRCNLQTLPHKCKQTLMMRQRKSRGCASYCAYLCVCEVGVVSVREREGHQTADEPEHAFPVSISGI